MSEDDSSPTENCATCGAEVDMGQFEPLASVECPVCGEPMVVSKTLGPYDLVEVMGRGGMGVVYRAIDHQLDRQVALKVLRDDHFEKEDFIKKLDEEAAITGGINHPHVVKVFTTGTVKGRFFIAMELVDKGTLDDLLELQGRIAESQALEIASQIAQGLRAAHALGLIHRDVKPGNILFGENGQAKIVDFGLAMLEEASKGTGEIWGTPYYVSPERLDQKPEDFRSDIYSLGATIFHAIAGRPPFEAEDATMVALKHLKSQAVSLQAFAPWVSGSTAFVINRMLNKEAAGRYDSYDELIEHLDYARAQLGTTGARPPAKKRVVLETDEDRKLWGQITFGVLGLVVLLALGTGAYFLFFAHVQPTTPAGVALQSVGATGKHAAEFEAARKLLLENKPAEAAAAYHQLASESPSAPLLQWSLLQEALADLLAGGDLPKAQAVMAELRRQKYAGSTPAARLQGDFFDKVAALIIDPKPISPFDLTDYNRSSYGALALLLAGLKDWELGDFENANTALRGFQSAAPSGEFLWITEYHPLVEDYLADLSTYRGAMMLVKSAKNAAELQNVAGTLQKAKADLRRGSAVLGPKLDAAARAALSQAKTAPSAPSPAEKEKAALADARTKAAALCKQWNFRDALAAVTVVPVTNYDFQREKRVLIRKLEWLTQFKALLIKDLAQGYSGPLKLTDGTTLSGPIVKASDRGIEVGTAGPAETRAWSEIAPESVLAMGESFITPALPPPQAAERRWGLGVYAALGNQQPAARKLLTEAAANDQYNEPLTLLLPGRRVDLAHRPGTVVAASDFIETPNNSEAPANAVDGKPETRWGSSAPGPKWLRLDLGKECHIMRWVVRHAHSAGEPAEANTAAFVFQRSADDKNWTDVDPVQGNTLDVTDRRVAQFRSRYVRLLITKPNRLPNDSPIAHIYGFEVYGWENGGETFQDFFAPPLVAAPPEFNANDIGLAPDESSGGTTVDDRSGIFFVSSAARGLGGKADACRFLHKPVHGSGQITIRIDTLDKGSPLAEAGVMIRDGSAKPDARCVYAGISAAGQLTWEVRNEGGGELSETRGSTYHLPCWLRLEVKGNAVAGSWSEDGNAWKSVGAATIDFGPNAELGVAAMSHVPHTFTTARLEVINFLR